MRKSARRLEPFLTLSRRDKVFADEQIAYNLKSRRIEQVLTSPRRGYGVQLEPFLICAATENTELKKKYRQSKSLWPLCSLWLAMVVRRRRIRTVSQQQPPKHTQAAPPRRNLQKDTSCLRQNVCQNAHDKAVKSAALSRRCNSLPNSNIMKCPREAKTKQYARPSAKTPDS